MANQLKLASPLYPEVEIDDRNKKNEAAPPQEAGQRSATADLAAVPSPFTPDNLRLSQAFAETVGVTKLLMTVPTRKPGAQEFVRVHPGPEYRENFPLLELKDEREVYLVTAELAPELAGEVFGATLFTAINRQGTLFFWPVRLPSADGKDLEWWRSAREAPPWRWKIGSRQSQHEPRRIRDLRSREHHTRTPMAGAVGFWDLIKIAFRDRLIDHIDHPVLKRLRGEA